MPRSGPVWSVRGGQTTQHWARMLMQVIRYGFVIAAFGFLATYTVLVAKNYEFNKVRITYYHWLATFSVENRGDETRIIPYIDLDGRRQEATSLWIYNNKQYREISERYSYNAKRFAYIALIPAGAGFFLSWLVFALVGRSLKQEEHVRGARLVTKKELKRWVRAKWKEYEKKFGKHVKNAPRYTMSGIEFAPNAVEAQIGITGTIGVGKTNAMHEFLQTIDQMEGRAIIYDRTGGLVRDHYVAGRDIILNPFDARSHSWTPFSEVSSAASFAQIAEVMIPSPPEQKDPFWIDAARLVFIYAARKLHQTGQSNNAALRKTILELSNKELGKLVAETPGALFFGKEAAKTSASIRASLITQLSFLEYMRDDGEPFSIRDWVFKDTPGFVFLTGDAEHSAATRNVISTVIEVGANALMTMPESRDPRLWFFLDEIPTLNRLPFLSGSLATIRQYGGAFVVGYQVYSQLEDIYGVKGAQTISGTLNNRLIFNTPDYDTAQRSSQSLGEADVIEAQESLTLGAAEARDAVGVQGRRTQRPIVTAAEVQALPQFVAYFRQAYDAPTARVIFEPIQIEKKAEPLVPYRGNGFDEGGMQLEVDQHALREGSQVQSGFAALSSQNKLAEFTQWMETRNEEAIETIATDRSMRLHYWKHYAGQRMRGTKTRNVAPPSMEIPLIGQAVKRVQRHTIDIPFPGDEPEQRPAEQHPSKTSDASSERDISPVQPTEPHDELPLNGKCPKQMGAGATGPLAQAAMAGICPPEYRSVKPKPPFKAPFKATFKPVLKPTGTASKPDTAMLTMIEHSEDPLS